LRALAKQSVHGESVQDESETPLLGRIASLRSLH
jgi:hypothetical protein